MDRRRLVSQQGRSFSCAIEDYSGSRIRVPVMAILVVYSLNLLDLCNTDDMSTDSPHNTTVTSSTSPIPVQLIHEDEPDSGQLTNKQHNSLGEQNHDRDTVSDSRSNDIAIRFNITSELDQNTSYPSVTEGKWFTTEIPTPSTRRDIYIRGHLLRHPPPSKKRTFHPAEGSNSGYYRPPNSIHMGKFRQELDSSISRRKRKHSSSTTKDLYNYKNLYDTIKGKGSRKRTEFYAWIFGAAMLGLGSLTTVASCFVFCFCSEKVRKKRQARARHGSDKAGEYQRVESVSSIVDHAGEHSELYDDQMDSVTII